jgi:phospholipase C
MTTSRPSRQPQEVTDAISRRTLLKGAALLGVAGAAAPLMPTPQAWAAPSTGSTPIEHIIISCQENRSFDHYYGFAPFADGYGVPSGYSQPDGAGGSVTPYHFTSPSTPDIPHS